MASSDEPRGGPPAASRTAEPRRQPPLVPENRGRDGRGGRSWRGPRRPRRRRRQLPSGPATVSITLTVNGARRTSSRSSRASRCSTRCATASTSPASSACATAARAARARLIVDGRTAYTCSMLAIEAQGKDIRTIEGLSDGTVLHPGAAGILEHDGTMCGFCTPGFVMSAVGAPGEATRSRRAEQAREALDGNICRCGTCTRRARRGAAGEGRQPWLTVKCPEVKAPARPDAARQVSVAGARRDAVDRQAASRDSTAPSRCRARAKYTLRHQPSGHALRTDPSVAASARARRVDRSVRGAEGARREGRAR